MRYEAQPNDGDGDGGDGGAVWWEVLRGLVPGEVESGALFVPVAPGQVADLVAARREADTCVITLRCALEDCGLVFPDLCPSVDAAGGPVVSLGVVDLATARCLALALSGHHPPGPRPGPGPGAGTDARDRAAGEQRRAA